MTANGLTDLLSAPLDRGRVKVRPNGRGGQLSYLETHDVIRTANSIFGFGKWGHEIIELRCLGAVTVHNSDKKPGVSVGYVCVIRLTVEGCVPMGGVGFGDATEYRESGPVTAHELAAKEAESDALKRALKNFGDQFGLALYDKAAASSGHVTKQAAPKTPITPKPAAPRPLNERKQADIRAVAARLNDAGAVSAEQYQHVLVTEYGVDDVAKLSADQGEALLERLRKKEKELPSA